MIKPLLSFAVCAAVNVGTIPMASAVTDPCLSIAGHYKGYEQIWVKPYTSDSFLECYGDFTATVSTYKNAVLFQFQPSGEAHCPNDPYPVHVPVKIVPLTGTCQNAQLNLHGDGSWTGIDINNQISLINHSNLSTITMTKTS